MKTGSCTISESEITKVKLKSDKHMRWHKVTFTLDLFIFRNNINETDVTKTDLF